MNFNSHCPLRIKEERLRLGLSQAQIAEKTGISREMWGRYERGEAIPGGEVLFLFASIGANVQFILTGDSVMDGRDTGAEAANVVPQFELLDERDKEFVKRLLVGLIASYDKKIE